MRYAARLSKLKGKKALLEFHQEINKERLRTMYQGDISNIEAEVIFHDPNRFSSKQRSLYWALLGDIFKWSGQSIEQLHDWFKQEYAIKYHSLVSLKDISNSTVTEVNELLALIIDFMFEFNVPFKEGYELLPTDESYYLYLCIKRRKCAVCGSHADIHHIDAVGNRKRATVDHSQHRLIALCRKHHNEAHNLGNTEFCKRNKVQGIKVDYQTLVRLGLMTKKQVAEIEEEKNNE